MKAEMKTLYDKLTKLLLWNEKLETSIKIREKFNSYNDKWKQLYVKMGKKNVIKTVN